MPMPTYEPDGYQVIRIPKTGIQLPEITDSPLLETMTLAVNVLFKISMWPGSSIQSGCSAAVSQAKWSIG